MTFGCFDNVFCLDSAERYVIHTVNAQSILSLMDYWVLIAIMYMRPTRQSRYFQFQFRDTYLPLNCRWWGTMYGGTAQTEEIQIITPLSIPFQISLSCYICRNLPLYTGYVPLHYICLLYVILIFYFAGPAECFLEIALDIETWVWVWSDGSTKDARHTTTNNRTSRGVCYWTSARFFTH